MEQAPELILVTNESNINLWKQEMFPNSDKLHRSLVLLEKQAVENMQKSDDYIFPAYDEGTILIHNPYNDKQYLSITDELTLLKDKLDTLSHVVKLLGAEAFYYELEKAECSKKQRTIDGKLKVNGWKAGVNSKTTNSENFRHNFFGAFRCNPQNIAKRKNGYDEAKKIVETTPLKSDIDIKNILSERSPQSVIEEIYQAYSFELSQDWNNKMDIAMSLQHFNPKVFNIGIQAQTEINTQTTVKVKFLCIWDWNHTDDKTKETWQKIHDQYMLRE